MEINITHADKNDAPIIAELGKQTFMETFSDTNSAEDMEKYLSENFNIPHIESEISTKDSSFFIAYCDGAPAAYMKLNVRDAQTEKQSSDSLEIQRIYVLKAYKGKHIGSALMRRAEEEAQTQGLGRLWLGVWEHNEDAKKFYAHLGFSQFSAHTFVLGTDAQTDFLLQKYL